MATFLQHTASSLSQNSGPSHPLLLSLAAKLPPFTSICLLLLLLLLLFLLIIKADYVQSCTAELPTVCTELLRQTEYFRTPKFEALVMWHCDQRKQCAACITQCHQDQSTVPCATVLKQTLYRVYRTHAPGGASKKSALCHMLMT
eukprot:166214-Pelagomonas_calceolata.AAC.5